MHALAEQGVDAGAEGLAAEVCGVVFYSMESSFSCFSLACGYNKNNNQNIDSRSPVIQYIHSSNFIIPFHIRQTNTKERTSTNKEISN